jgi:hypothetical protein
MKKRLALLSFVGALMVAGPTYAQLDQLFDRIFNKILRDDLRLSTGGTDTTQQAIDRTHGIHYFPAARLANEKLTPALNSLIASNVSSFPLSSTVAGVTFDISSGLPVKITESLGPIFAETAATLGKDKLNVGLTYSYLNLSKFRGVPTQDIRFSFAHQEISNPNNVVLGDNPTESDYIDLFLGLDVNAEIYAFFATYGVAKNLDIGLAVPFVRLDLRANAMAVINSYSFAIVGNAVHRFNEDPANPQLVDLVSENESVAGIGDIGVRLKYNFVRSPGLSLAALADIRLATGNEHDFLGTANTNARVSFIASKKLNDFSPHLNIGYERRPAGLDSDELEFVVGFDQKVASGVTFAAEFLGEFDLNRDETIELFPGTQQLIDSNTSFTTPANPPSRPAGGRQVRNIDLSNVPARQRDNLFDAALGFRVAASEKLLLFGNVIVPLNDSGLRSSVAPTFGVTVNF